jgi:hypothetical protein
MVVSVHNREKDIYIANVLRAIAQDLVLNAPWAITLNLAMRYGPVAIVHILLSALGHWAKFRSALWETARNEP